jgi:hypothetical protein
MDPGATTPDAVELTRRTFEYANTGEFDELMSLFGPESVWDMSRWGLGTYEGPAAIHRFFRDWFGAYETYEILPEEIVDLGEGVVFTVGRQEGRSAGWRAAHIRLRHAAVFVWVDGVALKVATYRDIDEARAAAVGLPARADRRARSATRS